jgi:hypothetical protein
MDSEGICYGLKGPDGPIGAFGLPGQATEYREKHNKMSIISIHVVFVDFMTLANELPQNSPRHSVGQTTDVTKCTGQLIPHPPTIILLHL